jgi:hypothetical protein
MESRVQSMWRGNDGMMRLLELVRRERLRTKLAVAAAAGLGLAVLFAAAAWWQASRALNRSAALLSQSSQVRFTVSRFDRMPPTPFEAVSAPAAFADARFLGAQLFICGPSGL